MRTTLRLGLSLLVGWMLMLVTAPRILAAEGGAKIFDENCVQCHTSQVLKEKYLKDKQLSAEEWKETLARMKGLGAEVPRGQKQAELLDYLMRTYGVKGGGEAPAAK